MHWQEKSWKIPRRGEVVRDPDGFLGLVIRSEGTLKQRNLWVTDIKGEEMASGEDATLFTLVSLEEAEEFHHKRLDFLGYRPGNICLFKKDTDAPLEIIAMKWNFIRYRMTFYLKDLKSFSEDPLVTENISNLSIPKWDFPPIETIFHTSDSGLKYRIEVKLLEKLNPLGWTNTGSPWEFKVEEDAINEINNWKARLKIRRISSVINGDWKIDLPSWTIEATRFNDRVLTRVKRVESFNGSPGYFRTGYHAAHAMKFLSPEEWLSALSFSQDSFL